MRRPVSAILLLLGLAASPALAGTIPSVGSGAWSNPLTWGGEVPNAGDTAIVSSGTTVEMDVDVEIDTLIVRGRLRVLRPVTVRFGDAFVDGGRLEAEGSPLRLTWTKLAADAPAGATELVVADDVSDWPPGQVVIAGATAPVADPSLCMGSFGDIGVLNITCLDRASFTSEPARVVGISRNRLLLAAPLERAHPGVAPRQTEVGLLTRSIVFTSIASRRGHLKVMNGGSVRLKHVEFAQLGRSGTGTYPIHLHQLRGIWNVSVIDGVSVWGSENLGIRIHGTDFATVRRSVVYDVVGHGISTEDGTERYNTIEQNLVVKTVFVPDPADPRYNINRNPNDPTDRNEGSGFWLTNLRNWVRGNIAADSQGWGFDLDPPLNVDAGGQLSHTIPVWKFLDNESHGSWYGGFNIVKVQAAPGQDSRIENLHVWEAANFTIYQETTGLITWVNPRTHDYTGFDVFPYRGGQTRFFELEADLLTYTSRRVWGWSVADHVRVNRIDLPGSQPVLPITIVVDGHPGTQVISFDAGSGFGDPSQPGLTSSVEVYLVDYDGPGQHVKLIHEDTAPFDTLDYRLSTRFGHAQEARFTDATWPEIALPLRIDSGETTGPILAYGTRWHGDQAHMGTPIGYYTPRFGHTGKSFAVRGDGSIDGSHRYGSDFGYTVDLPAGTYTVAVTLIEPSTTAAVGSRVIDVSAEGVKVLDGVDVFAGTGAAGVPFTIAFEVFVSDGQLNLTLTGRNGQAAVLSALVIDRW